MIPDERLAVASSIAAVTQFCRRFAVYTGREAAGVQPEDVSMNELVGGIESGMNDVTVSTEAVREVLNTGLFSSRGPNRIGWAHQTYSEFLAARFCKAKSMPVQQIRALLFHPSGQELRLIPQLHELAAWISAMDVEILNAVTASDPETLLGAAAASFPDDKRRLIVESLLQQTCDGRQLHLRYSLFSMYRKLKHSQLATQLDPYIRESKWPISVRHVAISIAWVCDVEELGPILADIALDVEADASLRQSAAAAAAYRQFAASERAIASFGTWASRGRPH